MIRVSLAMLAALALAGCSFHARSPDDYRKVTRDLVQTRSDQLRTCYEDQVEHDENAGGKVAIDFGVEAETGRLVAPEVVAGETTASEPLQQCVITALDGLTLDPPDERTARARFVWNFEQT